MPATNAKASKDDEQAAKVEAYLASWAQVQEQARGCDVLETTLEQLSVLDSRPSMIRDSATIPVSLWQPLRPTSMTPASVWQAESTLLDFEPEPEPEPIIGRDPEVARTERIDEQQSESRKRTPKEDADLAKDEQMLEITRCLAQLQEQNRLLMSHLATVTNLKSSFSDMASLAEPGTFNPFEGVKRFERNSTLIEF